MASSVYAEDLTCAVCLCLFTDPVTLTCGHSFCRTCITVGSLKQCPQCRAGLPPTEEIQRVPTSHILRSLSDKAKEGPGPGQPAQWLCPEHEEKLKLFCVTDQQLACTICRDAEKHNGHRFKPIREAAASLRKDLDLGVVDLVAQVDAIQSLSRAQGQALSKAKDLAGQLQTQVHRQFESMHQFLRKREDEIINELKVKEEDAVQSMTKSLKEMNFALNECREQSESWTELLKLTDPEQFLKRWTEEHGSANIKDLFKPRSDNLSVVQSPLFQGPFQSHLQFFMWKELLQVVEPRAELLSLRKDNPDLSVSDDGRSFLYAPGKNTAVPQNLTLYSSSEFSTGQHYWEVEVGLRSYWCLGIKEYFLKYENQTYSACEPGKETMALSVTGRFRKVGVYLDCSSKGLSFYDADSMVCVHTVSSCAMTLPVSACFCVQKTDPDRNPMTVCWY